jgi:translation initiation factor IF-3
VLEDLEISTRQKNQDRTRLNDQIRAPQILLIDAEGEKKGVVSREEALELAEQSGMDLVEISPNAEPPVCRIMDFGKFQFQQRKKQVAAKKKQKQIQVKEIKFRPTTEEADYQVKLRSIQRFIGEGDKVKVTIRFRGREMAHQDIGIDVLERVVKDLEGQVTVEQRAKREGRQLLMVLAPVKKS